MSKNKGTGYYYFQPFRSGSVSYDSNGATYIIDILSRDDILYFDDYDYLITENALEVLQKSNLKGVNIDNADVKFSIKHNIKYKNQKIPKFYRFLPTQIEGNELKEIFLDENANLIINKRIKNIITDKESFRLEHGRFQEIVNDDDISIQ
ncbi:hypothetical protein, partial [Klebsiella pneumoniae]|uniref:hypothetical protein n=1 Tax=Klebsiella pneumoniae TaxID=573 RepID=UPI00296233F8